LDVQVVVEVSVELKVEISGIRSLVHEVTVVVEGTSVVGAENVHSAQNSDIAIIDE